MNSTELENRLIKYAVDIINLEKYFAKTYAGNHLGNQLIRSATSPALNYAEAIAAESKRDFIHKISIVHKELRESLMTLKIMKEANLCSNTDLALKALDETNQLVSIFTKTLVTSKNKSNQS